MDSVGGMLDAFTAKEMTCFNAKVLDEHLPVAFDVLSDLVLRPRFDDAKISPRKNRWSSRKSRWRRTIPNT